MNNNTDFNDYSCITGDLKITVVAQNNFQFKSIDNIL